LRQHDAGAGAIDKCIVRWARLISIALLNSLFRTQGITDVHDAEENRRRKRIRKRFFRDLSLGDDDAIGANPQS